MKVTHSGVEVEYDEGGNRWRFELYGRNRSAESLAKAKEAIDKPVDDKTEKPFERRKAYYTRYNDDPVKVEITSIAESPSCDSQVYVWINRAGKREKVRVENCFELSAANTAIISELTLLGAENDKLEKQIYELRKTLVTVKL